MHKEPQSKCCDARMIAIHGKDGTSYWTCDSCQEACDPKSHPDNTAMGWEEEYQKRFLEPDFYSAKDSKNPKKVIHAERRFLSFADPKELKNFISSLLSSQLDEVIEEVKWILPKGDEVIVLKGDPQGYTPQNLVAYGYANAVDRIVTKLEEKKK